MTGYAHMVRLGLREGTYGRILGEYQFTFAGGGSAWVRTFDSESSLSEFLRTDVAVSPKAAERAIEELRRTGEATIAEVEIEESEAPAMGLEQLPSDS